MQPKRHAAKPYSRNTKVYDKYFEYTAILKGQILRSKYNSLKYYIRYYIIFRWLIL